MPTLAQLPTDNLYKFIALAGVALVFFGIYLFVSHLSKVETKLEDLQHAMARAGAEIAYLEREIAGRQLADISAEERVEFGERVLNARLLHEENVVNTAIVARLNTRLRLLLSVGKIVVVLGLVLTVIGFALWYVNTQGPQDQLLQAQLKSAGSGHALVR
jgi:hypothetical protein